MNLRPAGASDLIIADASSLRIEILADNAQPAAR